MTAADEPPAWQNDEIFWAIDEAFADASIDALQQAPDVDSSVAEKAYDFVSEKQRAKVARMNSENAMRSDFFKWSSKLATMMIVGNFVIFGAYVALTALGHKPVPEGVMLAWISATVVEILGVVAIIARHLFPGKKRPPAGKS